MIGQTTREERRQQILDELRQMSDRLARLGRPATVEEMEAVFRKADELPLAGRSLEDTPELQTA
jgi:hypothetical protein